jgi:Flp pilus assembly protein TadG
MIKALVGDRTARLRSILNSVSARRRALRSDESGAAAVLAAILFPVIVGGMGLGAEAGYWQMQQRKLQHAADASVHAAAVRKRSGDAKNGIDAAALHVATQSGFSTAAGTIAVNTPPASGTSSGDRNSVEVLLSHTQPLLFSSVFRDEPVTLRARAVVQIIGGGSQACVLALSPTAPAALQVAGSTIVTLNGCDVASNSNASDSIKMHGDAKLTTDCAYAVGEAIVTTNLTLNTCPTVSPYAPVTPDPYADLQEPALSGTCRSASVGDTTLVPTEPHPSGMKVMRFCDGLNVKGTVTFEPGLYIIEAKDFAVNAGAVLKGSGVTFYFAKGAGLKLNGGATTNFSAPASGPFSGVLFFGERSSTVIANQVNGASGSTFDGAIYFPGAGVEYSGRAGSTGGCTQIIGRTVTFIGNSEVKSDCQAAGTRSIATNQTIRFVE